MKALSNIFPAVNWISEYDRSDIKGDLSAGVTVGVMLIPQSMAYAMLAGVPPIYGLYAGLVPLVIYALLGTSRHLSIGPVAVDMIIVGAGVGAVAASPGEHIQFAILVAAMTGLIEIAMGTLRFGFMVNFLSRPVIAGFMTAAPLIIAAGQLGNLMGVELAESQYVHIQIASAVRHVAETNVAAISVGLVGIVFLLFLQVFKPRFPSALFWVAGATFASWAFGFHGEGVSTVGAVPEGLPALTMPEWSVASIQELAPTALTLALVQFMSVMSLGKAFATEHEYSVDANRELFAIGFANLVGSFFRSITISGSFSRSAVNDRSGANTPLTNVIAAALVGLTLLFLTPLFRFLPVPALAAIIIVACIGMIDVPELRYLLETRWIDGAVALTTFAATLVIGIQEGILIGVATSILVVLWDLSQPHVVELGHVPGTHEFRDVSRNPEAESISDIHIIRIDSRFSFANAERLKEEMLGEAEEDSIRALVIDTSGVNDLDTTATQALTEVVRELGDRGIEFYVAGAKGPVRDVMRRSGLLGMIGEENFFLNSHLAVSEILEGWNEETEYGPTEQEQRREEIDEAREKLQKERERIEDQRRSIGVERKRLEEEISEHETERNQIDMERERLRDRLREARKRRRERRQLDATQEELDARKEELDEQEEELEQRREQLEEREEELDEQHKELQAEREQIEDERKDIVAERDRLQSEIENHVAEKEEIEGTRSQLHQELEEAEKRRSELQSERERMQEEKQELKAERKRLEAERRRAASTEDDEASDDESESNQTDSDEEFDQRL